MQHKAFTLLNSGCQLGDLGVHSGSAELDIAIRPFQTVMLGTPQLHHTKEEQQHNSSGQYQRSLPGQQSYQQKKTAQSHTDTAEHFVQNSGHTAHPLGFDQRTGTHPDRHGHLPINLAAALTRKRASPWLASLPAKRTSPRLTGLTSLRGLPRRSSGVPAGAEITMLLLPVLPVLSHLLFLAVMSVRTLGTPTQKGIIGLPDGIVHRLSHQFIQIFKIAAVKPFRQCVTKLLPQCAAACILTH